MQLYKVRLVLGIKYVPTTAFEFGLVGSGPSKVQSLIDHWNVVLVLVPLPHGRAALIPTHRAATRASKFFLILTRLQAAGCTRQG
jgi:hypothetical protein